MPRKNFTVTCNTCKKATNILAKTKKGVIRQIARLGWWGGNCPACVTEIAASIEAKTKPIVDITWARLRLLRDIQAQARCNGWDYNTTHHYSKVEHKMINALVELEILKVWEIAGMQVTWFTVYGLRVVVAKYRHRGNMAKYIADKTMRATLNSRA